MKTILSWVRRLAVKVIDAIDASGVDVKEPYSFATDGSKKSGATKDEVDLFFSGDGLY